MAEISFELVNSVGWIVLNRPTRGNALSASLVEDLIEAVQTCIDNDTVHTVVIAGAGRHFCTGFDLDGLDQSTDADLLHRFVRIERLLDLVWRAPLRTVAVAHGRAIGAGADLCVACDQRVLTADASVRFPGAGFGIVLGSRRLGLRVGETRALQWVSEGLTIDSKLALETGLASQLAADECDAVTDRIRSALPLPELAVDRQSYAALKQAIRSASQESADCDLAALVRSASRPGLQQRLLAYRDRHARR
ncbi:MAG: enoyl-CoA hydratase/isomerase family protein [Betaproteobacteria bacterium]|nr:enoyl-CoA hydratase/isomerase family protein [Betaproteobacteria bacterium]